MNIEVEYYNDGTLRSLVICNDKGQLHNEKGPARQKWYENGQENYREYWIDGELHNEDGPAIQEWYENGQESYREYWIGGEGLTEEEFNSRKDEVEITVEGNTKIISRKSAESLNLI